MPAAAGFSRKAKECLMAGKSLNKWVLALAIAGVVGGISNATPPTATPSLPSQSESLQLVEQFARGMASGDLATVDQLIDWDAVVQTATVGVEATDRFRDSFQLGLKQSLMGEHGFVRKTRRSLENGGTIRLLRTRQLEGQSRALLRVWPARGSLVYDELLLARRADGAVRVIDIYIFGSGELISESLHRSYLQAVAGQGRTLLGKSTAKDDALVQHLPTVAAMTDNFRQQKFAEALAAYRKLPESLQRDKNLLLLRVSAAQKLGADEYSAAVDAFHAAFPRDPALDIVLVDYYLKNQMTTEGLACVDRIDRAVGGDPGLAYTRAQFYLAAKQLDAARAQANQALAAEPRQTCISWTLTVISAEQQDFAETVRLLRSLREKLQVPIPDLTKIASFNGFVQSPEYAQWRAQPTGN
jgi:tetratricopeptide (TPR) repeat protein